MPSPVSDAALPAPPRTLAHQLVAWFAAAQRTLPWRENRTPYRVWLSEIMLQQTRVSVVEDYFRRFTARFPSVQALAAAREDDVLALWSGLGYYSRGRNLHAAARRVVEEHGGAFPQTAATLATLPGVGPYTAAAVASFAFGEDSAVVDGNVLRVVARLTNDPTPINEPRMKARAHRHVLSLVQAHGDSAPVNEGLMELGALVCTPKNPACDACPWHRACAARAARTQCTLPNKAKKKPSKHVRIACVIVRDGDRVWLERRNSSGLFGGLYEPPCAVVEGAAADDDFRALLRARRLPVPKRFPPVMHVQRSLTHRELTFDVVVVDVDARAHPGPWHAQADITSVGASVGTSSAVRAVLDAVRSAAHAKSATVTARRGKKMTRRTARIGKNSRRKPNEK